MKLGGINLLRVNRDLLVARWNDLINRTKAYPEMRISFRDNAFEVHEGDFPVRVTVVVIFDDNGNVPLENIAVMSIKSLDPDRKVKPTWGRSVLANHGDWIASFAKANRRKAVNAEIERARAKMNERVNMIRVNLDALASAMA